MNEAYSLTRFNNTPPKVPGGDRGLYTVMLPAATGTDLRDKMQAMLVNPKPRACRLATTWRTTVAATSIDSCWQGMQNPCLNAARSFGDRLVAVTPPQMEMFKFLEVVSLPEHDLPGEGDPPPCITMRYAPLQGAVRNRRSAVRSAKRSAQRNRSNKRKRNLELPSREDSSEEGAQRARHEQVRPQRAADE